MKSEGKARSAPFWGRYLRQLSVMLCLLVMAEASFPPL